MSTVNNLQRLVPGILEQVGKSKSIENTGMEKSEFSELFSNMIDSVTEIQHASGDAEKALLAGDPIELHEVMIKGQEAGLAMDLLLEIRNKLLDGYSELMRMPM